MIALAPPPTYRFLPWVRQGFASAIPPGSGASGGHATLPVKVSVRKGDKVSEDVAVTLRFYGPGDVLGIDPKQIIRTDPRPGTSEFEPNYLAAIEFDLPDYPWLFSPDLSGNRMRPWLCLVVVRRDRGTIKSDPRRPLPWLELDPTVAASELPDLSESWAWAHAQLVGTSVSVPAALAGPPERTLSRLLSPRRLEPSTAYVACLVPAFEAGRQAGLGLPVTAAAESAWPPYGAAGATTFELPVYYHWEFATSVAGDFETLARRLQGVELPDHIGTRPLDVSDPGFGLPQLDIAAPGAVLDLEGVLCSPALQSGPWPDGPKHDFQVRMRQLLAPGPDTVVGPPLYGGIEAGVDAPPADGAAPLWLGELNLDPRYRVAAGLGAEVVSELQEQLVASAWDQAGALEQVNALLRNAQLSRAVGGAVQEKRLQPLDPPAVVRVTQPLHGRVRIGTDGLPERGTTLHGSVQASVFPESALSQPFRRVVRPSGPVGRRLGDESRSRVAALTDQLAAGEAVVPIEPARGAVAFDDVGGQKLHDVKANVPGAKGWRVVAGQDGYYPDSTLAPDETPAEPPADKALEGPAVAVMAIPLPSPNGGGSDGYDDLPDDTGETAWLRRRRLSGINTRFRDAAVALADYVAPPPTPAAAPLADGTVDLGAVARTLRSGAGPLAPDATVPGEVLPRVPPPPPAPTPPAGAPPPDPLVARPTAPSFPQAMAEPLRRIAPDLLLPGADEVPPDSAGVLVGNARFIEAYMVGLNTALARELMWRGLPTDLRATFFQWFWDVRGRAGGAAAAQEQIPRIADEWDGTKPLGGNARHVGGPGMLVLVVRAELLRRYPTTPIYAVQGATRSTLGAKELQPEFRGNLPPDLVYVGFDLDVRDACGDPGWFFVFQEQPTAPRFGFDEAPDPPRIGGVPSSWSDLDWSELPRDAGVYKTMSHAPVASQLLNPGLRGRTLGGTTWGADSAQIAAITLQQPVRVAIHASRMVTAP
jgi:hypothetical protein